MLFPSLLLLLPPLLLLSLRVTCQHVDNTIDTVTVNLGKSYGQITGLLETFDNRVLRVFRGIPYARPPLSELRFRRPVPLKQIGSVEAFHFRSSCVQNASLFEVDKYLMNKTLSEDCLYLNIWSPIDDPGDSEDQVLLRPVMVWIHGGGFLVGGSSEQYYQGDVLAAKEQVVVVSINYRVNTLGFLYTGREDAPGNVGLLDQTLALEWIKDNVRYFGGDPDRVTIFGESAGGWSVSLHLVSPASRGLFRNAIINSGAYLYKFCDDSEEDHKRKWLRGAKMIGCHDDQSEEFTDHVMDCLRRTDPFLLATIVDKQELIPGSVKVFEFVVVDGQFLTRKPLDVLRSGMFNHQVNLLVSTVEDEGAFLINNFNDPKKFDFQSPLLMSLEEAKKELSLLASEMNSHKRIDGQSVAKHYYHGLSPRLDPQLFTRQIGVAVGDYYLTCPTLLFAKEVFYGSGGVASVYQYYYNSKFADNFFCSQWMGVCHTNDYFPMFGMPFMMQEEYNDREREISSEMMAFLAHFARTGNPGKVDSTEWEKWYSLNDNLITPYYEITNWKKNVTNFGIGLKLVECDYLWKKHIV